MRWSLVLVLAGCSYKAPAATPDDGALDPDVPVIDIDAAPGDLCLGSGNFQVCVPIPTQPFAVPAGDNTGIDTNASPSECLFYPQPGGRPTLCVIAATSITVQAAQLFASGDHPLVLFASDSITIGSGVDVGSHRDGQARGAGADSAALGAMAVTTASPAGAAVAAAASARRAAMPVPVEVAGAETPAPSPTRAFCAAVVAAVMVAMAPAAPAATATVAAARSCCSPGARSRSPGSSARRAPAATVVASSTAAAVVVDRAA